ncbi:hypothetical protein LTR85_009020 [Meristemomyces frigidus]|nr:hypothetical protein LTR85_009020 [Meristemomyces frigidus]
MAADAKRAEEARTANDHVPLLRLPAELLLRIFEPCMIITFEGIPARDMFSIETIRNKKQIGRTGPSPLATYGSICRTLRPIAVTAYYGQSVLHLRALQDPHQRIVTKPKPAKFARFGKLQLERGGWKRKQICELKHVGRKGYVKEQYGLELPPKYVREHVRRIFLELLVPGNILLEAEPTRALFRPTFRCTSYDDESNDWLAPIFAMQSQYGYKDVKEIAMDSMVSMYTWWESEERKRLRVWVDGKLKADAELRSLMENGLLRVKFAIARMPTARMQM